MAHRRLSRRKHAKILDLAAAGKTTRQIQAGARVSAGTVSNYTKIPLPKAEKPDPRAGLPESWNLDWRPFCVDGPARVLVLGDVHIPFHSAEAIEAAVVYGRAQGCDTVLLNGDALDCHRVSKYPHDGTRLTYQEELEGGRQFLAYLRGKFPKARLIFKEGNHEERLEKYILSRAEALFGIVSLPELLRLAQLGVEHVRDQRVVRLGKLRVIHGHEYGGGASNPVNAARWLFVQANGKPALCGHLHQVSEQVECDIDGQQVAAWSAGCLCGLNPNYRRIAKRWSHGFAVVHVARDGGFEVDNKRIMGGKVM